MLGSPFPIERFKFRPVDRDRLSPCVLALCLSDLDALMLTEFELFTLQLREGSKHGQHKFARRCIGVDALFVTDEGNALCVELVDDVQQIPCGL